MGATTILEPEADRTLDRAVSLILRAFDGSVVLARAQEADPS